MSTKRPRLFAGSLLLAYAIFANAETPVEVKLIAAIEEDRGWCLDLRGRLANAQPVGGLHGHTCDSYAGNGLAIDQAYAMEEIQEENQFRLIGFENKCMTLFEPQAGSFISMETCDGRATQEIVLNESGRITPKMMPELCLTMSDVIQPGGGGTPLHIMRDVTFEDCDSEISELQLWELRAEWTGPQETTAERPYASNPNAPPPPGMGAGMGAGMGMGN
jgi:hypothetical protein